MGNVISNNLSAFFASKRILTSRIVCGLCTASLLFSQHSWPEHQALDIALEALGFVFVVVGTFVRLWCAIYIYGYKGHTLVQDGPYSIVRNPLYIGSLLGAVGLGLMSENVIFFVLLIFFFLIYYPFVVINEERELEAKLGDTFKTYKQKVPRFIPNFSLFSEPQQYEVYPKKIRRAFLDAVWFLWAVIALEGLEFLKVAGVLPVLFYVP